MARATVSRRWRSALRAATLLALCATLLAGCGLPSLPPLPWQQSQQAATPLPDAQQVAHIALPLNGDPNRMLDPTQADVFDPGQAQLLALLYSGLVTLDARLRPAPSLAASYSESADGLTYTFHLRANTSFADGEPITAGAISMSLNRAMTCGSQPVYLFSAVKDQPAATTSCQAQANTRGQAPVNTLVGDALLAPDPITLVIRLSRPDAALLTKLAEPYSYIVEPFIFQEYGAQWTSHLADDNGQGSSGMYKVTAWTPGDAQTDGALTLMRRVIWWGQLAKLREVVVSVRAPLYSGTGAPASALTSARYSLQKTDDIAFDTTPTASYKLQADANGMRFSTGGARAVYAFALNTQIAPLIDERVRMALAMDLDKTAMAKVVNGIATNHLIPSGTGDYHAALSGALASAPLDGDLAQAQALWSEYVRDRCGDAASRCPALTMYGTGPSGPSPLELATIARWRTALPGIRITILTVSNLLMTTPTYQFASLTDVNWYEDYPDPQDWLTPFAVMPGAAQSSVLGFPEVHDARADMLVALAEATLNTTTRLALYQQAENTLLNDAVVIPIAQEQDTWAAKPTVVNFPANPAPWIAPSVWARIYLSAPGSR